MISRYEIFCKVIETASFTRAAEQLGYSQSAVSQIVKALEREVGHTLVDRRKDGISLTRDGRAFYPYFQQLYHAEQSLRKKVQEMRGLQNSVIRIGTFTSVSRVLLPPMIRAFKAAYPGVQFVLQQGDYTDIARQIRNGSVDFGFISTDAVTELDGRFLFRDDLMAILPPEHPLAEQAEVTLEQLAAEPFILLGEGDYSVTLHAFQQRHLTPQVEYQVHDDYAILTMVKQGLGVSAMYRMLAEGFEQEVAVRPISGSIHRSVALAWNRWETMPLAAQAFASYIIRQCRERQQSAGEACL